MKRIGREELDCLIVKYRQENPLLSKTKLAQLIANNEQAGYAVDTIRHYMIEPINQPNDDFTFENTEFTIDIPETWYKSRSIFQFPSKIRNMLIISDLQMPFHDSRAIRAALAFGYEESVDAILINGDLADFYTISRFIRNPKYRDFEAEVHNVSNFLHALRKAFPDIPIYWKLGNHELRLETMVFEKAPELAWYHGLSIEEIFDLKRMQIKLIEDKRIMQLGQLYIIHGHEYRGAGAVNIARNLLLKAFDNILCSHFHRMDEHYWTPIGGNSIGSWVTGCLCGLSPDYMPINNWLHGFARVLHNEDGTFEVENRKIIRGKVF